MARSLDTSAASLTIDLHNSSPTVYVGTSSILVCCNEGLINKVTADSDTSTLEATKGPATSVVGKVFLAVADDDFDIGDWQFGMVQVSQLAGYRFLYAGKTDAHGSISVNRAAAYTKNPSLDVEPLSGETVDDHIFTMDNLEATLVKQPRRGFNITVTFGDHPTNFMPLVMENRVTGAQNFIARAYRNEAFITYFLARENASAPITCIGRVGWHVVVAAEFNWKTGAAKPARNVTEHLMYQGEVRMGAPPDSDPHFTVARTRATPTTNKQDEDAADAIARRREPVIKQETSRPSDLHADFFK
jgi:hypothetical protein